MWQGYTVLYEGLWNVAKAQVKRSSKQHDLESRSGVGKRMLVERRSYSI